MSRPALVAYFALYQDLYWVLEEEDQRSVLELPPSAFDDDQAIWAVTLAQLYSNATTATAFPAVVTDATGRGTAFTYDLAANVVYTRQGNPALAGQDTDNDGWYRAVAPNVDPAS